MPQEDQRSHALQPRPSTAKERSHLHFKKNSSDAQVSPSFWTSFLQGSCPSPQPSHHSQLHSRLYAVIVTPISPTTASYLSSSLSRTPNSSHTLIPSGTTMHGSPIFLLPLTPFMPSLPPLHYLNSIVKHHTYTLMPLHPFLACNPDPTLPTSYVLLCNGAWLEKIHKTCWLVSRLSSLLPGKHSVSWSIHSPFNPKQLFHTLSSCLKSLLLPTSFSF